MKKNVLLASAVLMTLGMAGNVHADEKVAAEKANVTAVEPKLAVEAPKTATVEKKDAEKAPVKDEVKPAADTEDLDAEIDELEAEIDKLDAEIKAADAADAKEYEAQIAEWTEMLVGVLETLENVEVSDEFRADIFVKAFYFDVIDLQKDIQAYIAENGSSEEAKALLDGLNEYLNEVGPVMKQLAALVEKYNAGQLTAEELLAASEALFNAAEQTDKQDAAPKSEVAPVATQEVAAPIETLPETGSDDKSFISVIGTALAGLTVWGFGFKKRG